MADWAAFISVPFGNLQPLKAFRIQEEFQDEFISTTMDLIAEGCDGNALMTALVMANTAQVPPFPRAPAVKSLAKKMRVLADEITEAENTNFLVWQTREIVKESNVTEDADVSLAFPHFHLPMWLRRRAEMYDEWLKMAQDKIPPRRELFRRVRRVYPVLYVKWATGQQYCEKVATLLRLAGIVRISATQLDRELQAFESDYPMATSHIRSTLQIGTKIPTSQHPLVLLKTKLLEVTKRASQRCTENYSLCCRKQADELRVSICLQRLALHGPRA